MISDTSGRGGGHNGQMFEDVLYGWPLRWLRRELLIKLVFKEKKSLQDFNEPEIIQKMSL